MRKPPSARELDVVLYGATGFTGRLVASYLARRGGARVGLAGRSLSNLRQLANDTGWDAPLIECASDDVAGLSELAARTRVVLSTAGPYSVCGTPLVAACAAQGTDYLDINGEVPWVRDVIQRFDESNATQGTVFVPNCGYTVLSDVGTYHAASLLRSRLGQPATSVRSLMQFNGRLSGGTMATGILLDSADERVQACRRDPFALGGAPLTGTRPEDADPISAEYDEDLGCWTAPFWMADIDSRVVRRSSALFGEAGGDGLYSPSFVYRERALAADESVARNLASPTPDVERRVKMVQRGKLPSPGHGPSLEVREKSWFRLFFYAQAESGAVLTCVEGGDPGYEETSKMVAEAAILLATQREHLPASRLQRTLPGGASGCGGVLTPAFAFGDTLVHALSERGLHFRELALVGSSTAADAQLLDVEAAAQLLRSLAAQPRRSPN